MHGSLNLTPSTFVDGREKPNGVCGPLFGSGRGYTPPYTEQWK